MHSFLSYKSLPHALSSACEEHGERTAFIEVNRKDLKAQFSFLQVLEEAKRFAVKLGERGIRPGDHVAIVMQNQSKWPLSAFGVFLAGAVLVPIDYKLGPDDQRKLFQHSKSKLLITEYPRRGDFEGIDLVLTEAPEDANLSAELRWERGGDSALYEECSVDKDDVATIVYSSGTGGAPRGCMLTHANYLAQLQQLRPLPTFASMTAFSRFSPATTPSTSTQVFSFPSSADLPWSTRELCDRSFC